MAAKEELELRKLEIEIDRRELQNQKLSKELAGKRPSPWQMPSVWEMLKSIGIFLPLLFASLGYCRSLEQDRRTQLEQATKLFLGNDLGAGPHMLAEYAEEHCGQQGSCGEDLECREKCRQTVAGILVSGVRIRDEEQALERSRLAMQTLIELRPNKALGEELCRRVAADVVSIHERYIRPAVAARDKGVDDAQAMEAINTAHSALHRLKPVVCAAVETRLCPEARLKALAPNAWEETQVYFENYMKPACKS